MKQDWNTIRKMFQSICPTHAITVVFPEQMVRNQTDVVTLLGKVVAWSSLIPAVLLKYRYAGVF